MRELQLARCLHSPDICFTIWATRYLLNNLGPFLLERPNEPLKKYNRLFIALCFHLFAIKPVNFVILYKCEKPVPTVSVGKSKQGYLEVYRGMSKKGKDKNKILIPTCMGGKQETR